MVCFCSQETRRSFFCLPPAAGQDLMLACGSTFTALVSPLAWIHHLFPFDAFFYFCLKLLLEQVNAFLFLALPFFAWMQFMTTVCLLDMCSQWQNLLYSSFSHLQLWGTRLGVFCKQIILAHNLQGVVCLRIRGKVGFFLSRHNRNTVLYFFYSRYFHSTY